MSDPFFVQRRYTVVWRVPEGSGERWFECTSTYASHNGHIGLMVSLKNGAAIKTLHSAILNNHLEGHRPLTQCVQPRDLKGFLIQHCKHLLNVIKKLGALKHSTEMSHNLDLQFSLAMI